MNFEFLNRLFVTKKTSLSEDVKRGENAEQLLSSAVFQDTLYRVRRGIHERWAASPVSDVDGQHELRLLLKVLADIEGNLTEDVRSGRLAQEQINQEQAAAKRKKEREERGFLRSIR